MLNARVRIRPTTAATDRAREKSRIDFLSVIPRNAYSAAVHGSWYRWRDLGKVDGGRYLFIEGRIKEVTHRGVGKILPTDGVKLSLDTLFNACSTVAGMAGASEAARSSNARIKQE